MAAADTIDEREMLIAMNDLSREEQDGAQKVQVFAERLLSVYNDAALALMISIGHRTGLSTSSPISIHRPATKSPKQPASASDTFANGSAP